MSRHKIQNDPDSEMTQILETPEKVFKITIGNMPCVKYG